MIRSSTQSTGLHVATALRVLRTPALRFLSPQTLQIHSVYAKLPADEESTPLRARTCGNPAGRPRPRRCYFMVKILIMRSYNALNVLMFDAVTIVKFILFDRIKA